MNMQHLSRCAFLLACAAACSAPPSDVLDKPRLGADEARGIGARIISLVPAVHRTQGG